MKEIANRLRIDERKSRLFINRFGARRLIVIAPIV